MLRDHFKEGEGDDEHRHRCMVRYILELRVKDKNAAHSFLVKWNDNHPKSILERDVKQQWKAGNRGEKDKWL